MSKYLPKSEFSRNVLKMMTGTSFAQVLPLLAAPVLTRLFTPEEFGIFYLYSAFASMGMVIASGKYELGILLPKSEKEAAQITSLSAWICVIFGLLLGVFFYFFAERIALSLGKPQAETWLYVLPASVFVQGWFNVLNTWHNRKKRFGLLTTSRFLLSGGNAGARVVFGLLGMGVGGLVFGTLLGQFIGLLTFVFPFLKKDQTHFKTINKSELKQVAVRYANFPKNMIAGSLFFKGGYELPNILFNSFFAATTAGFFGQMQAIIRRPLAVIGKAFEEVFRQRASEEIQQLGHCKGIFNATAKKLVLIGLIPFIIFGVFAPPLFAFVFGEAWRTAGEYAQVFTLPFFLNFVTAPLSSVFYLREKTHLYTWLEGVNLSLMLAAFAVGYLIYDSAMVVVYFMAMSLTILQVARYFVLNKIA